MRRYLLALFLILSAHSCLVAQRPATGQEAILSHEIQLLEFIGGGSRLTPAERAEVARAVADAMQTNPQRWSAIDLSEQRAIDSIEKNDPAVNNAAREASR